MIFQGKGAFLAGCAAHVSANLCSNEEQASTVRGRALNEKGKLLQHGLYTCYEKKRVGTKQQIDEERYYGIEREADRGSLSLSTTTRVATTTEARAFSPFLKNRA